MREAVDVARKLFLEGLPLIKMVNRRLAFDLELFSRGGLRVLEKIEQQNYNVLAARPDNLQSRSRQPCGARTPACRVHTRVNAMTDLDASYAFCRRIARTRARNFYYSFLLLSREQRDAMCAIYAFMRYCDDISEGEGASARSNRPLAKRSGSRADRQTIPKTPSGQPSTTP